MTTIAIKLFFKGIIEKGLKITWETPNGVRADKIDEETVKSLKSGNVINTKAKLD